ncbi:energy-coupled thiamine transporter ThiT [Bacillus pumilus]|uniref:energy-coupled thiamine transporter ThiT n=1 Tax=Bacillus pumilus TaxID=1408 RepID=UPI0021B386D7|nr:energy-coupled thiamine transporter ThiT [Bacillus pumilus]
MIGVVIGGVEVMNGGIMGRGVEGFLDYLVGCVVIWLRGVFCGLIKKGIEDEKGKEELLYIRLWVFVGSLLRVLRLFICGVVLFCEYAGKGRGGWI